MKWGPGPCPDVVPTLRHAREVSALTGLKDRQRLVYEDRIPHSSGPRPNVGSYTKTSPGSVATDGTLFSGVLAGQYVGVGFPPMMDGCGDNFEGFSNPGDALPSFVGAVCRGILSAPRAAPHRKPRRLRTPPGTLAKPGLGPT